MGSTNFDSTVRINKMVTHGTAVIQVTHEDLTAAATSQVLTLNAMAVGKGESPVPAKAKIVNAWINVITAFSGGAVSALLVKLGDAGSDNELITNVSCFTGGTGIKPMTGSYAGKYEAAYAPIATFTSTDGNMSVLDAGLMEICIQYEQINDVPVTA
jgi:hypothetical protein